MPRRATPMLATLALLFGAAPASAQARRVVVIKVDGLGQDMLDRWLNQINPQTGKSILPWMHYVFVERGARLKNFYVRGISLSVPSWSMLDTGHAPVIHGNAEFDRFSGRVYDYMNFFPFYFYNARNACADMPGVDVLDEAGIPLLIDSFTPAERLQSMQLFQRGIRWQTVRSTLARHFSRGVRELFNEWQTGFELTEALGDQVEHELIAALAGDRVLYLDYFFGDYDHMAHLSNHENSQRRVLEKLDRLLGRIWTAVEDSPLSRETVLALVSDHGMNSDPAVYSQGFNLISVFGSTEGGGHHVLTNRHPESEYKLKGLDPFVSQVVTPSRDSLYLRGEAEEYPTALLDLDGNERAAVYLRNSDVNALHLLIKQPARATAADGILRIIDSHRGEWARTAQELDGELGALSRAIERHHKPEIELWEKQLKSYTDYRKWLAMVLKLKADDVARLKPETLIPKRAMMDRNSIYQLQNYVIDSSAAEFKRVDYFRLLTGLSVRNAVQPGVGSRPVDFIAVGVPWDAVKPTLAESDWPDRDAAWLYWSEDRQALILSRRNGSMLRYLPVHGLKQDIAGRITFKARAGDPGCLEGWHDEEEWFSATHTSHYSSAIIGLAQHFAPIELGASAPLWDGAVPEDTLLLRRFALRLRNAVAPDLLVLANDHWNFNVRGFNPGGNHGSFLRVSTHSVLMFAGAGVPSGTLVERPYDSLSFVPTILSLIGRGQPDSYPGPVIQELRTPPLPSRLH